MKTILFLTSILFLQSALSIEVIHPPTEAVYALIRRVSPLLEGKIILQLRETPLETFTIGPLGDKVLIKGDSALTLSVGFNHYLNKVLNRSVSWTGDNVADIEKVILDFKPISGTRNFNYTYYLNVCTFSYSMVWWDWQRWERELDFMALRGINLALAFVGQEYVYLETMKQLNVSEQDVLNEYFTGPAFLAWQRMGNIRGWAGPLRKSWIIGQFELQKLILPRMRELGIKAIFPAFSGFVPQALKTLYPNANISQAATWNNFPENFTNVHMIEPMDPLFSQIAKLYTDNLQKLYGMTDHLYNGDQFNEIDPSSTDAEYLKSAGEAMINGLKASDPQAVWVLQGWLFAYSDFWKNESRIADYLSGIAQNDLLILDLWSEVKPVYNRTQSYFGKRWIWNELHDFGGNMGLYGKMPLLMTEPSYAFSEPKSSMVGVGLTMEGIFQNMIVYDLLLDVNWLSSPKDLKEWTFEYINARYGFVNEEIINAWGLLLGSVYNCSDSRRDVTVSYIEKRPTLSFENNIYYNKCMVFEAGKALLSGMGDQKVPESFKFDLVDIIRQSLSDLFTTIYHESLIWAIENSDLALLSSTGIQMLEIIDDLDFLLGTREELLLGKWLSAARKWAGDELEDLRHYRFNAKNQLTMWGPDWRQNNDYASKQWNGLLRGYYSVRWRMMIDSLVNDIGEGKKWDEERFNKEVGAFEKEWNYDMEDNYEEEIIGDTIDISKYLMEKYAKLLSEKCQY